MSRIEISHDIDTMIMGLNNLEHNFEDAKERVMAKTARTWKKEGINTLNRNGSNVTGTAQNSFKVRQASSDSYGIYGAGYLETVDMGAPSHFPNISNYRFQEAARQYGLDPYLLARTIARKGARPHPWMQETTNRTNKTFGNRLNTEVSKAISKSIR